MSDQIAKVIPAGVIAVGNIFEISAWVIPPIRYGEPGTLTSAVNPITSIAVMRGRNRSIIKVLIPRNSKAHKAMIRKNWIKENLEILYSNFFSNKSIVSKRKTWIIVGSSSGACNIILPNEISVFFLDNFYGLSIRIQIKITNKYGFWFFSFTKFSKNFWLNNAFWGILFFWFWLPCSMKVYYVKSFYVDCKKFRWVIPTIFIKKWHISKSKEIVFSFIFLFEIWTNKSRNPKAFLYIFWVIWSKTLKDFHEFTIEMGVISFFKTDCIFRIVWNFLEAKNIKIVTNRF